MKSVHIVSKNDGTEEQILRVFAEKQDALDYAQSMAPVSEGYQKIEGRKVDGLWVREGEGDGDYDHSILVMTHQVY